MDLPFLDPPVKLRDSRHMSDRGGQGRGGTGGAPDGPILREKSWEEIDGGWGDPDPTDESDDCLDTIPSRDGKAKTDTRAPLHPGVAEGREDGALPRRAHQHQPPQTRQAPTDKMTMPGPGGSSHECDDAKATLIESSPRVAEIPERQEARTMMGIGPASAEVESPASSSSGRQPEIEAADTMAPLHPGVSREREDGGEPVLGSCETLREVGSPPGGVSPGHEDIASEIADTMPISPISAEKAPAPPPQPPQKMQFDSAPTNELPSQESRTGELAPPIPQEPPRAAAPIPSAAPVPAPASAPAPRPAPTSRPQARPPSPDGGPSNTLLIILWVMALASVGVAVVLWASK